MTFYPWGKARSLDAGAGPVSRPMTGLNAGSIPAPGSPRCTHPNLFGMKGHCVWCGADIVWGPRLVYSAPVQLSD